MIEAREVPAQSDQLPLVIRLPQHGIDDGGQPLMDARPAHLLGVTTEHAGSACEDRWIVPKPRRH